jgi:hypothetical protein
MDIRPVRRRDGRETLILVWRTHYIVCGTPFEETTPQRKLTYPLRRCRDHRRQRVRL